MPGPSGSLLHRNGPYSCSEGANIDVLINVLLGFFRHTNNQINSYTVYVIFNLHVTANASTPTLPAPKVTGAQVPRPPEHVSAILQGSLAKYLYTPPQLAKERSNLNQSWYQVPQKYQPITEYFTIHEAPDGTQNTPDGWPCSKYVQLAEQRRALLGYGEVDPQLGELDSNIDNNNVVFPPGYLTHPVPVSLAPDGRLNSGCLYTPGADGVSEANSSWAISSEIPVPKIPPSGHRLHELTNMVLNLTACGLSPALNSTILNTTADKDISLYRNISLSSSWAWAIGEPRDATGPENRCAVMDLSLTGHWRAANCNEIHHSACRVQDKPYVWSLSQEATKYSKAPHTCPDESWFDVPRTGLENTYLYNYLLSQPNDTVSQFSSDPVKREVWLDFNSIDIRSCWVSGGPGAGCPYASDPQQLERRTVLVATIAGIVICIIAALTLFVKCNANRRNSRRGRRVIDGWEYEGVPS